MNDPFQDPDPFHNGRTQAGNPQQQGGPQQPPGGAPYQQPPGGDPYQQLPPGGDPYQQLPPGGDPYQQLPTPGSASPYQQGTPPPLDPYAPGPGGVGQVYGGPLGGGPVAPNPSIPSLHQSTFDNDHGDVGYRTTWENSEAEEMMPLTQQGNQYDQFGSVASHGGQQYGQVPTVYPPTLQPPGGGPPHPGGVQFVDPGTASSRYSFLDFPQPMPMAREERDRDFVRRQTVRRGKTRKVKLTTDGHWVQEYPVPKEVLDKIEPQYRAQGGHNEFTHMRYTAATCDPDDFTVENGWELRATKYNRETDLLIAVTSYNEDKKLYARTLHALMKNIRFICQNKNSKYWRGSAEEGRPGWQRITVALVADGIGPMDTSVLDILGAIGLYQDGVMKKSVNGKTTVGHIFEYTTQLSVTPEPKLVTPEQGNEKNLVPVQFIFVLKQANAKKINSHRWLFNALGEQMNPDVCVLLDAGTMPEKKAIYHLWEAFYNDVNLGGACGEITAQINKGKKLINPLVAAQNFEYKMSNILDKPFESAFGYVAVLPGAFSAYRFQAIKGAPLGEYFKGEHRAATDEKGNVLPAKEMNIFKKNMFLAEDRILCFELVAKAGAKWTLTYVKPSKAETDVPDEASELISQRRRWLNGSFAAGIYSLVHFTRMYKSKHGPIRMFFFHVQAAYNVINTIFSWFALANLWLTFSIIIQLLPELSNDKHSYYIFYNESITAWVNLSFEWVYLAFLSLQFVLALGNRPKGEKLLYMTTMVVFALLSAYLIACSLWLSVIAFKGVFAGVEEKEGAVETIKFMFNSTNGVLVAAVASTVGIYLIASLIYRDPWHMFSSFPQYMIMAPNFINVLNVYAFCNLHDVSWGTKGSDKAEALPTVTTKKKDGGKDAEVDDAVMSASDMSKAYKVTLSHAITPLKEEKKDEKKDPDDANRTFRTNFVAAWMLSNAALAVAVGNINGIDLTASVVKKCLPSNYRDNLGGTVQVGIDCIVEGADAFHSNLRKKQQVYFQILLWGTFGLTAFRFIGCMWFWFGRQFGRLCRKS